MASIKKWHQVLSLVISFQTNLISLHKSFKISSCDTASSKHLLRLLPLQTENQATKWFKPAEAKEYSCKAAALPCIQRSMEPYWNSCFFVCFFFNYSLNKSHAAAQIAILRRYLHYSNYFLCVWQRKLLRHLPHYRAAINAVFALRSLVGFKSFIKRTICFITRPH